MELLFDKTLKDWAEEYYIDFKYMEINLCKNNRIITVSEYEVLTTGEDGYACMYSFYKYPKKEAYSWITYGNGQNSEYKRIFSNQQNREDRTRLCRVNTKELVEFIRENEAEYYDIQIIDGSFFINGINIETLL